MRAAAQGCAVTQAPAKTPCSMLCFDVVQNDCLDMAAGGEMNVAIM